MAKKAKNRPSADPVKLPWPDDPYQPHFPSLDGDYFQRLADNAERICNPLRLMCKIYTPEEEAALAAEYRARLASELEGTRQKGTSVRRKERPS